MDRRRPRPLMGLLVTGLAAAAAFAQHAEHGQQTGRSGENQAAPFYTGQDLHFLQHMIVHHEQALVMADLVPARSERADFLRFARYVDRAQASEIALMRSLLDLAAEHGIDIPDPRLDGDPPMTGMLSSEQMESLAAASGVEFERLWLEGMIFHHEGAIDMARMQQRHQLDSGRRPFGLSVLVEDIIVEQRAEISRMQAWLRDWHP